ncbi:MAG: GHKL domain-containing protein [Christensenellales bacterium]|jgi:signal transduction histidine kinase
MLYFFGAMLIAVLPVLVCLVLRVNRQEEELRREAAKNAHLQNLLWMWQNRAQEIQTSLQTIQEVRHDLRHYLRMLEDQRLFSDPHIMEQLRTARTLLNGTPMKNASIGPVSILAEHYAAAAERAGAKVDIKLDLDACYDEPALTLDLCLVVGNLLENAVEALERQNGGWLRVRSTVTSGWISLVVGNSSSAPLLSRNGRYLSSKAPGRFGIGLDTVQRIAAQYGGKAEFCAEGSEFKASVFLPVNRAQYLTEDANFPA